MAAAGFSLLEMKEAKEEEKRSGSPGRSTRGRKGGKVASAPSPQLFLHNVFIITDITTPDTSESFVFPKLSSSLLQVLRFRLHEAEELEKLLRERMNSSDRGLYSHFFHHMKPAEGSERSSSAFYTPARLAMTSTRRSQTIGRTVSPRRSPIRSPRRTQSPPRPPPVPQLSR